VKTPGKEVVEYTIFPLPELSVAGMLSGKIFVELMGKTKITSSGGYSAELEFIPKGWFTGEYFQIKGNVKDGLGATHSFSGNWTTKTNVKSESGETALLFDAATAPHARVFTPLETQTALESHTLWGPVTAAINAGDYYTASKVKLEIEDSQRQIRKQRKEDGGVFEPKYFTFTVPDPKGRDLEGTTPQDPQQSGTWTNAGHHVAAGAPQVQGHWVFKE
jgi:Oxysterol-binding protein